ncbi:MAG: hypothetical protein MZV70_22595 [Desulfobacterales bacterium]|nr:hypothetical protein [Desulfobacterales bacterium]
MGVAERNVGADGSCQRNGCNFRFLPFGAPVVPHYAWSTGHPICAGISDWSWADPGLGILNCRFTVGTATPVTGWSSSPTAGQAGIRDRRRR